jgi:hypothetical protein
MFQVVMEFIQKVRVVRVQLHEVEAASKPKIQAAVVNEPTNSDSLLPSTRPCTC